MCCNYGSSGMRENNQTMQSASYPLERHDAEYCVMVLAGEASGDALAAGLIQAIQQRMHEGRAICFWGAGGQSMAAAGVEVLIDFTRHGVFGLVEVLRHYFQFRRWLRQLVKEALERKPQVVVLTDYAGFNLRFAKALRHAIKRSGSAWSPRIIYYVSPQVWASRASRVFTLQNHVDCLLSLFPFEKAWYRLRAPGFRVEYVGDPMRDRYQSCFRAQGRILSDRPCLVLLPGSREGELKRHLPLMSQAMVGIEREAGKVRFIMVLSSQRHVELAKALMGHPENLTFQVGSLSDALAQADLAIACSGTVTRECAYHGVPTVVFYRLAWLTYQVARLIVQVKYISMANLMLGREVFPELIQGHATPKRMVDKVVVWLRSSSQRQAAHDALADLMLKASPEQAFDRAAQVIWEYLSPPPGPQPPSEIESSGVG